MANEYLKRTPTSTGNGKVFTWSGWVKKQQDAYEMIAFSGPTTVSDGLVMFGWGTTTGLYLNFYSSSASRVYEVDEDFRDFGSWLHYQISVDTTQVTEDDRINFYINGAQKSLSVVSGYSAIPQNYLMDNMTAGKQTLLGAGRNSSGTLGADTKLELSDIFFVDGQALTPDVFGFYKDGDGYISVGSEQATDFRPGQWMPHSPSIIKKSIERRGGFGVNGFYLPMNDSSNPGADFHCAPNSIITLKGEDLPQPRNGAPTTTDAYVSQLRSDPYAANLVLAVPGISTSTSATIVSNGHFDTDTTGWTVGTATGTLVAANGELEIQRVSTNGTYCTQQITTETGKRYTVSFDTRSSQAGSSYITKFQIGTTLGGNELLDRIDTDSTTMVHHTASFTATGTTAYVFLGSNYTANSFWDNIVIKQEDVPRDYSADIKGSGSNKTLTPSGGAGVGYELGNYYGSAMTFDGTDDYISVPNTSDLRMGSNDFTVECWLYAKDFTGGNGLVSLWNYSGGLNRRSWLLYTGSSNEADFIVSSDGTSSTQVVVSSPNNMLTVNEWNHIVGEKEGTTIRLYVNGVVVAISNSAPSSLYENTDDTIKIGTWDAGSTEETNGYIQDVRVYKGVAKYKGGFDVPKPYTPVGFEGDSWRTTADTCKNNFATLNPLKKTDMILSEGNLKAESSDTYSHSVSTIGASTGKYYWETTPLLASGGGNGVGLATPNTDSTTYLGIGLDFSYSGAGTIYGPGDTTTQTGLATFTVGDVIGVAMNLDSSSVTFYKNGTSAATVSLTSGETYFAAVADQSGGGDADFVLNFGQNPSFGGRVTAGTFTDSNGKGLFKYEPPSGFLALCEDNLPTPAIADPGEHFKTVLYVGDGNGGRSITGVGFSPNLVWVKRRQAAANHFIFDSVRGAGKFLISNNTNAEGDDATNTLMSFDSDGFTSGNTNGMNQSGSQYVAWCWKAGGPAVSNTDGTITSQVSANQDAGFSIVSYTGNGTIGATVGHGLGKKPKFFMTKNRDTTALDWPVFSEELLGSNGFIYLTSTNGGATIVNISAPTSSVLTLSGYDDNNKSGDRFIAYCWAEIEGFSKFGSYVGNGSADGPFVYCGFKPAFVMIKRTDTTGEWWMYDSSRGSTNPNPRMLLANNNGGENEDASSYLLDFLSNGFKWRSGLSASNGNGGTYIFAAFAESPFQTANAK